MLLGAGLAQADFEPDLIPDAWELSYYLSPLTAAPLDDTDGDTFNTWEEWKAGTSPIDGASFPANTVSSIRTSDGSGFDGTLTEINGDAEYDGGFVVTDCKMRNFTYQNGNVRHYLTVLKFDLSSVPATLVGDVALKLTLNGSTSGSSTKTVALFSGNDALITRSIGYNRANPFIDDAYVPEVNGDTDFASGTVEPLFTFSNSTGGGTVETLGSGNAKLRNAVFNAFATDDILTLILYGGSSLYLTQGDEDSDPDKRPTLVIAPLNSFPDEDADTLPDAWEAQYLVSLAYGADDDPDGDGVSNHDEWLAGTRPDERAPFTKLVTNVTYDGTGNLVTNTFTSSPRGDINVLGTNNWGGTDATNLPTDIKTSTDPDPITFDTNIGLVDSSYTGTTNQLGSVWHGTKIRIEGGQFSQGGLTLRGGVQSISTIEGRSVLEIDINILNGKLDVGALSNGNVTVNMLAGGTGQFNLADMYGTAEAKSKLDQMILNFETGSSASFTIASNNGVSAGDAWETKIAAGEVKIDGAVDDNTSSYLITSTDGTNTTISLKLLDLDPPTPNLATFSSAPSAAGIAISMTATTGTDASGPVEYYFAETSGNPGGDDSGWQTSPSYTDGGLDANTQYTYTVQMRDSATTPNVGDASSPASATTDVYTAAEHFIAPTGSDASGDGSIANPYETITKAQSVASSGDTVYLRGGTYYLETSDVTYSFSAWDSVNHMTKNGISYIAYQGETPIFDFSAVQPVDRRVTAFLVEADNCVFEGFEVVGVQVTIAAGEANNTQSECFRIVGGNNNRFERLSMHDGMGIGWYLTSGGGNLVINCDAYNNKGLDGLSHGNIDGFGAHTNRTTDTGNTFIGCRAWFNSDDGFDLINNDAAVVISNCWAMYNGYDHESPSSKIGDSTGFKGGGYGVGGGFYPTPVPRNRILYCLAVENSRGFYANHHTGGLDWIGNTAISNGTNYNMLNNLDATAAGKDVPGFDHYMKNNLGFGGDTEVSDLGNSNDVTDNYWTLSVTVTADDFKSLSYAQLTQPRQADGSLPEVDYAHLATGSDLIDAGTTTLVGVIPYYSGSAPDLGAFEYSAPLEFWNQWLNNYLGGMGSDINLQDDADGDRLVNLAEYAFGGDPSDSNDQGNTPIQSQVTDGGTNYIEYVYFERDDAATRGLNSIITVTTDLMNTNWADGSGYEVGRGASEVPGYNAVTNRIPTDVEDRQFIRVEIELAP